VLARSRRYGFGFNRNDVVPELTSIAIPLLDNQQRPFAAIGVTGSSGSLCGGRLRNTVQVIQRETRRIEREHAQLIGEISH
jgi:DNA-binding IclR family transcriptional regulator